MKGIGQLDLLDYKSVTYLQPSLLQLQLTLRTPAESLQGPGPPADPTGSHWPSTNTSGLETAATPLVF
jgi:hypothetical protein